MMSHTVIKKLEKTLTALLLVLFLAVILINGYIYYNHQLRLASSNPDEPFNLQHLVSQTDTLTIGLASSKPNIRIDIYLNGQAVATLSDQETVNLTVKEHDLIQARGNSKEPISLNLSGGNNIKKAYLYQNSIIQDQLTTIALIRLL
ncbi:hypothetical protein [Alkaliphilus crotonatoxidans]